MIGTVEFNSATLYRYASVAAHELHENLSSDAAATEKAVQEFVRAFLLSMPTGKQNTFAAHTLPFAVMVALRKCRPLNLADAFEKPVAAKNQGGFAKPSAAVFVEHAKAAYKNFCAKPESCYVIGEDFGELGERLNLEGLMAKVGGDVKKVVM